MRFITSCWKFVRLQVRLAPSAAVLVVDVLVGAVLVVLVVVVGELVVVVGVLVVVMVLVVVLPDQRFQWECSDMAWAEEHRVAAHTSAREKVGFNSTPFHVNFS
jgi:hypothetical protein